MSTKLFFIIIDITLVINIKFIVRERERCAARVGEVHRRRGGGARTTPSDRGDGLDPRRMREEVRLPPEENRYYLNVNYYGYFSYFCFQ
jgi:hypothetical protein